MFSQIGEQEIVDAGQRQTLSDSRIVSSLWLER